MVLSYDNSGLYELMTKKELHTFYNLIKTGNPEKAGIFIRHIWSKRADVEYLSSFKTIHWTFADGITHLIEQGNPCIELSCQAYETPPYYCGYVGGFGLLVKGKVTLAGNGDLGTLLCKEKLLHYGKKYTLSIDRLFVNQRTCNSPFEFILNNWQPIAIVIDNQATTAQDDPYSCINDSFLNLCEFQNKLPIIDIMGKKYQN